MKDFCAVIKRWVQNCHAKTKVWCFYCVTCLAVCIRNDGDINKWLWYPGQQWGTRDIQDDFSAIICYERLNFHKKSKLLLNTAHAGCLVTSTSSAKPRYLGLCPTGKNLVRYFTSFGVNRRQSLNEITLSFLGHWGKCWLFGKWRWVRIWERHTYLVSHSCMAVSNNNLELYCSSGWIHECYIVLGI